MFVAFISATTTPLQLVVEQVEANEQVPLLEPIKRRKVSVKNMTVQAVKQTPEPKHEVSGTKQQWMRQAGIRSNDYKYVEYIVQKESGWRYTAQNPTSSAYGLCQTMMSVHNPGGDFRSNPVTQLKWCNNYAVSRYGSWANAYSFWTSNHWW